MKASLRYGILATLLAVLTALCFSRGDGRNGTPDGWSRHTRGQVFVSQAVLASGPQSWGVWSLAAYQAFVSDGTATEVSVEFTLPPSGRIVITPHHRAQDSTSALVIEEGSPPRGVMLESNGAGQDLRCTGNPSPTNQGRISTSLTRSANGWSATIGDQRLDCATTDGAGQPAVTAGLRRVAIHSISTGSASSSGPGATAMLWGLGAGLGFFGLLWAIGKKSPVIATAVGMAAASGWLLLPFDGARLSEILRLIEVRKDHLPLTFAVVMATTAGAVGLSIYLAKSRLPKTALLPTLVLFLMVAGAWPIIGTIGWLYAALGGLSLGGLVWVNVHAIKIRRYNLIALALAGSLLGSMEVMARFSHVGSLWSAGDTHHGPGSMSTLMAQFEGLKSAAHTLYPGKGFPIQVPPKQGSTRIVCLGASSTGGAFQNDSLDDFYPAHLAAMAPPGVEVVNQGVGGWTSFHIRKFLDGHADSLNAEVWTLFLGVNEKMPSPMSFADLYEVWLSGGLGQQFAVLDNIRLFQGLRLLVRGIQPGAGAGVPPEDFQENLEHIITLAQQRGAKVLLMSEGIRPDHQILWRYAEVMDQVAQGKQNVHYLDTALVLDEVGDRAFIDSNHLNETGHRTMAMALKTELNSLGWW